MQHDDELWEELIKLCLHKAEMVSMNALCLMTNFPCTFILNNLSSIIDRLACCWSTQLAI